MQVRHILIAAALAAPLVVHAQSYRCTGKDGKRYYGATIPPQCIGQTVEQLSPQGVVIRRIEGQMSPEERAKRDAEAKAAAERDAEAKEQARRNRALLAAYQSEKDIEDARQRALEDNAKGVKEIELRMAQIKKRQEGYQKEMEFYAAPKPDPKSKAKPAAAAKPPAKLLDDIAVADREYKMQEDQLAQKKKEVEAINARYDDDKKRFQELQKAGGVAPAPAAAPAAKAPAKK